MKKTLHQKPFSEELRKQCPVSIKIDAWEVDIRTTIDRKTGEFNSKRIWTIVSDHEFENPDAQIELNSAQSTYGNVSIGDEVEEDIDQEALGRIEANHTKNIFTLC